MVPAGEGSVRVTPTGGTGDGRGTSKLIVPVEICEGVAPLASTEAVAVPAMSVLPRAAAALTMLARQVDRGLVAGDVELLSGRRICWRDGSCRVDIVQHDVADRCARAVQLVGTRWTRWGRDDRGAPGGDERLDEPVERLLDRAVPSARCRWPTCRRRARTGHRTHSRSGWPRRRTPGWDRPPPRRSRVAIPAPASR